MNKRQSTLIWIENIFYGTDCAICTNTSVWEVLGQKGMDQYQ